MNKNKYLPLAIAAALGSLSSIAVNAAGFQLAEYSATGLGRAYAGEAAMADNASSQWRNPALLTDLEGTQVSVGAIYVDPNIDVNGEVSFYHHEPHQVSSEDFAHAAVIPNFYFSHQVNEQLALGVAFGTNYGMETDLGTDFGGSHFGNKASIISKEANFNAAYKIAPAISLGAGLRVVMADGSFGATMPEKNLVGAPQGTTLKYMAGDDISWGWQAGATWQINDNNRLGFAYKSEVNLTLEGHAEGVGFDKVAGAYKKPSYAGSMDLALPATAEIASFHQITDKLAMHASINWTDWSSFKELKADIPQFSTPQDVKLENWKDNYRFALGATYQVDDKLALRSGVAFDTAAVDDKYRTATIPETDRTWLSVGAGYQWSEELTFDAGFTYIFAKDASFSEPRDPSDALSALIGGGLEGQVTGNVWLAGVQATYRF
ncbi:outer membrane protein transport protein [Enterovibrio coralii]|uniref:Aromatic hydrocarbon degradation protein n=1 Tax=Enterovibrio coralii TaxID=294935 RepID=A0A135I7H1_9GAMM|nr:outer membrane protein transport protein [Enterovibrio coralii]KXF81334.1 aromatic hydrocarbon degradation protein [Enterovibrio coralii]